jgi:hypothetical protein
MAGGRDAFKANQQHRAWLGIEPLLVEKLRAMQAEA